MPTWKHPPPSGIERRTISCLALFVCLSKYLRAKGIILLNIDILVSLCKQYIFGWPFTVLPVVILYYFCAFRIQHLSLNFFVLNATSGNAKRNMIVNINHMHHSFRYWRNTYLTVLSMILLPVHQSGVGKDAPNERKEIGLLKGNVALERGLYISFPHIPLRQVFRRITRLCRRRIIPHSR